MKLLGPFAMSVLLFAFVLMFAVCVAQDSNNYAMLIETKPAGGRVYMVTLADYDAAEKALEPTRWKLAREREVLKGQYVVKVEWPDGRKISPVRLTLRGDEASLGAFGHTVTFTPVKPAVQQGNNLPRVAQGPPPGWKPPQPPYPAPPGMSWAGTEKGWELFGDHIDGLIQFPGGSWVFGAIPKNNPQAHGFTPQKDGTWRFTPPKNNPKTKGTKP